MSGLLRGVVHKGRGEIARRVGELADEMDSTCRVCRQECPFRNGEFGNEFAMPCERVMYFYETATGLSRMLSQSGDSRSGFL